MSATFIIAQIFGTFGLAAMVVSLFQSKREKMLKLVSFNCIFFAIEYLLLAAYSGMGSNIIALIRTILFKKRTEDEKFNKIWVYLGVMAAYAVMGIITYQGPISLLPIIAEFIYATALWQIDVKKIRYGTAVMVVFWLIYDILVKAWPSMVCDLIVLTTTILSIIKYRSARTSPE